MPGGGSKISRCLSLRGSTSFRLILRLAHSDCPIIFDDEHDLLASLYIEMVSNFDRNCNTSIGSHCGNDFIHYGPSTSVTIRCIGKNNR